MIRFNNYFQLQFVGPYFLTKDKKIESLADLPQGQYLILFFWTREPAIGYPV